MWQVPLGPGNMCTYPLQFYVLVIPPYFPLFTYQTTYCIPVMTMSLTLALHTFCPVKIRNPIFSSPQHDAAASYLFLYSSKFNFPRARVDLLILKKATRALNGPALLFCVQMVKSIDRHTRYLYYIYLTDFNLLFNVSVQIWVLALYFLFIFPDFCQ